MSNTFGTPGQDLPDPILPGQRGDDAVGRPDNEPAPNHDLPAVPEGRPGETSEPDESRAGGATGAQGSDLA
ncbi:hypothetical protein [Antarcticirhabdus aurantiaca]|uniref:Uncharacterized protein n=1 Tax=Antarcticirhabdus aurantiaca TaxID=2606717 RepID=A0ACD4NRZ6_9HYPH|nr:hypothetical protein [Antarcticirhabdus aurantiaca]WAJ29557.1 hypothetical protein OXU80_04800 [Jeongeuplla avenae]